MSCASSDPPPSTRSRSADPDHPETRFVTPDSQMTCTLPAGSRSCSGSHPQVAARQRPSGRSHSRSDRSTITSPTRTRSRTQIRPGIHGANQHHPHRAHSPPQDLTPAPVQIRSSEHEPPAILAQCPRRSSNSQPTIPIARCGSGTESSGSRSRHGPLRPDQGGRPTPTTYAWESTIVDPVPAIPLPFRTSPSRTCPERSSASANLAARSSTPAISGPYAGTPRAARSRWPPHPPSRDSTGGSLLGREAVVAGPRSWRRAASRRWFRPPSEPGGLS
jgi:hypothetical protein